MRKVLATLGSSVLALGLASSVLAGSANAAAPSPTAGGLGASGSITTLAPDAKTCASNAGAWNEDGITAQDFGSSAPELNSEGAADFSITKKKCKVGTVEIPGYPVAGIADSATVWIYKDDDGLPGKEKCTATSEGAGPDFTVTFTDKCKIKKGDYWLGAQVSMDFATQGQWFWATTNEIQGSIDAWRNPGGGFGSPCTDWGYLDDCIGFTYDYIFTINKK